jgi:hypothetical protein
LLAANDAAQAHLPHQARHSTTGGDGALAAELPPDLAHAIDGEIRLEHLSDPCLQCGISPRPAEALPGSTRCATRAR